MLPEELNPTLTALTEKLQTLQKNFTSNMDALKAEVAVRDAQLKDANDKMSAYDAHIADLEAKLAEHENADKSIPTEAEASLNLLDAAVSAIIEQYPVAG